jgi:cobalt-precorrin 5A hydrolase/precorrin-3B C17-methyltransferase
MKTSNRDNTSKEENGTAIFAVTAKGAELGRQLKILLPGSNLYIPEKLGHAPGIDEHAFSSALKDAVRTAFNEYTYLVLIMAAGIAVRMIAPLVKDKQSDPGVVVIDDGGTFAISLLSGHVGGANEFARKVAAHIGATPVVTTASEIMGTIPVDIFNRELGWEIEGHEHLTTVSAALVNGEPVGIYQDAGEQDWQPEMEHLPDNVRVFSDIKALHDASPRAALVITDRILDETERTLLPEHTVIYRPPSLVVGIGCNRGTTCAEIEEAINTVFSDKRLSSLSIRNIATIDLKEDEAGLGEYSRNHDLRVDYFDSKALRNTQFPSPPSTTVLKHTGTPAVCESAAILSSGGQVIVPKVSYNRAVTVAVARIPSRKVSSGSGKLFVVGLGPGDPAHMTLKARAAIDRSDVVIGYRSYIKLIESLLINKEVVASGMGAEVERVKKAIAIAETGKTVSIVSSGDSGVYGMAGLVGELMPTHPGNSMDIEVIPGIPALAASATLLGSPLTGDFVSISLSDYLVSWEEIRHSLELAAQGNFAIILYNPKSAHRQHQLVEARDIIMQHRPPSTAVGIVTNAYRQGQQVIITDIEHMLEHRIGMSTNIIIGTSKTFVVNNWMITPRGYDKKYNLSAHSQL